MSHARYDWINLRLQDFKSVAEYNSALLKITLYHDLLQPQKNVILDPKYITLEFYVTFLPKVGVAFDVVSYDPYNNILCNYCNTFKALQ